MRTTLPMPRKHWIVLLLPMLATELAAQAAPEQGSFVVRQGADTIAVERFSRTPQQLQAELETRVPALRLTYAAALSADALIPHMELEGGPQGAPPAMRATAVFEGDSAHVDVAGGATQRFAPGRGALPYVNLSGSVLEQIVRRARALGGESVAVPMLNLQGGQAFQATVQRIGADSVRISIPPGVEIRAAVDANGRLLGATVPSQNVTVERVPAGAQLTAAPPPDYSAPAGAPYTAEEVRVQTPAGIILTGTLTVPRGARGRVPAVLLLSGSGAQDRDEAIPGVAGYRPFRQVADTLSRRGIAVLRLDDRGVGGSGGEVPSTSFSEFADDARAALAWLRARPEIDPARVGIVGHSEGALVGPMVAVTDPRLRALALLAAPAQTGRQIVAYQQCFAVENDPSIAPAARDSLLKTSAAETDRLAASSRWFASLLEYDPLPIARRLRVPVLILQGATDRQVTADQAEALAATIRAGGNRSVTVKVLPAVNHLFLRDPDGNARGYAALPSKEVVPEALGTLADWLSERLR